MSTVQDTVLAVAPVAAAQPTAAASPAKVAKLLPTIFGETMTVEECERTLSALFRDYRPGDHALREIGAMASLADHAVSKAHASTSAALDDATRVEDYTNCAALYGYVLGFAAAERTRRGA